MNTQALRKRESDLAARLTADRATYEELSHQAANGDDSAADRQAAIRTQITSTEGQLTDVRAALKVAEQTDLEARQAAAKEQRKQCLREAIDLVQQRAALAKDLEAQIDQAGSTYQTFIQLGINARRSFRSASSGRVEYENFDLALGAKQSLDQNLAGLMELAGFHDVILESGPVWKSVMRDGPAFSEIQSRRSQRAVAIAENQLAKEGS